MEKIVIKLEAAFMMEFFIGSAQNSAVIIALNGVCLTVIIPSNCNQEAVCHNHLLMGYLA